MNFGGWVSSLFTPEAEDQQQQQQQQADSEGRLLREPSYQQESGYNQQATAKANPGSQRQGTIKGSDSSAGGYASAQRPQQQGVGQFAATAKVQPTRVRSKSREGRMDSNGGITTPRADSKDSEAVENPEETAKLVVVVANTTLIDAWKSLEAEFNTMRQIWESMSLLETMKPEHLRDRQTEAKRTRLTT